MTRLFYAAGLACLVLVCAGASRAPDPLIVISDELSANAEALDVKMGWKWSHRVRRVSFGEYSVGKGSSQVVQGTASSTTKEAKKNQVWQRVSTTKARYDFTLGDSRSNVATVQAVNDVTAEEFRTTIRHLPFLNPKKLLESGELPLWNTETYWEPDEGSSRSQVFSAVITTGAEDADTWVLVMAMSDGGDLSKGHGHAILSWGDNGSSLDMAHGRSNEGEVADDRQDREWRTSLSNGERQIQIVGTTSNKHGGDSRAQPALGYEFVEGEQTLCALQYHGGGSDRVFRHGGDFEQLIWIDSRLDQRMKLILAAAMTSLLQLPGIGMPGDLPGW